MEKTINQMNQKYDEDNRPIIVKNGQHVGYRGEGE